MKTRSSMKLASNSFQTDFLSERPTHCILIPVNISWEGWIRNALCLSNLQSKSPLASLLPQRLAQDESLCCPSAPGRWDGLQNEGAAPGVAHTVLTGRAAAKKGSKSKTGKTSNSNNSPSPGSHRIAPLSSSEFLILKLVSVCAFSIEPKCNIRFCIYEMSKS